MKTVSNFSMGQCSECGFLHPPVGIGQCPIANEKKVKELVKADNDTLAANHSYAVQKLFFTKCKGLEDKDKFFREVTTFMSNYK